MPGRVRHATVLLILALSASFADLACGSDHRLPPSLSDAEFWRVSTSLSELAGAFAHSDNLVSNEIHFVQMIGMLRATGGAYIGTGPEQNFSYIARLQPAIAFIIDIRRENRNLHLMYKALFELSDDRADFMSRLFSRERPAGLGPQTTVQELFIAYEKARPAPELYAANAGLIQTRLLDTHGFPLSWDDLDWIEYAFRALYSDGPDIHYGRSCPGPASDPTYRVLMTARDARGQSRSYLASEQGFAFVKDLHRRNMIVPLVGDFAGPDAIRRTSDYIRQHGGIVQAFYASNVEVYLSREEVAAFCGNLGTLPYDSRSWFIGSKGMRLFPSKLKTCPPAAVEGG